MVPIDIQVVFGETLLIEVKNYSAPHGSTLSMFKTSFVNKHLRRHPKKVEASDCYYGAQRGPDRRKSSPIDRQRPPKKVEASDRLRDYGVRPRGHDKHSPRHPLKGRSFTLIF